MKQEFDTRYLIQQNAKRIVELHERIHMTLKRRHMSPEDRAEWSHACHQFHDQYDALAFPGGYDSGLKKLQAGDGRAIADALVFIEVRPYFFRSQYIRTKLIRMLKRVQLPLKQSERFQKVLEREKNKRPLKPPH